MAARLLIDDSIFQEDFGVRAFRFRHRLAGHPFLRNAAPDPLLGGLLDECLDEFAQRTESLEPGMHSRRGFVFASAPRAATPPRVDSEHGVLVQLSGATTVHVLDGRDRGALSELELERVYTSGGYYDAALRERQRSRTFVLGPGDGIYIPVTQPHWVQNGEEASRSFRLTFRTHAADTRARLYRMNARLRALGLPVVAPGVAPAFDRAKLLAFEMGRAAKRLFTSR